MDREGKVNRQPNVLWPEESFVRRVAFPFLSLTLFFSPWQFAYHWVIITHLAMGGVSAVEDEEGESDSQVRTDVVR